jgi:hypothetical protein
LFGTDKFLEDVSFRSEGTRIQGTLRSHGGATADGAEDGGGPDRQSVEPKAKACAEQRSWAECLRCVGRRVLTRHRARFRTPIASRTPAPRPEPPPSGRLSGVRPRLFGDAGEHGVGIAGRKRAHAHCAPLVRDHQDPTFPLH